MRREFAAAGVKLHGVTDSSASIYPPAPAVPTRSGTVSVGLLTETPQRLHHKRAVLRDACDTSAVSKNHRDALGDRDVLHYHFKVFRFDMRTVGACSSVWQRERWTDDCEARVLRMRHRGRRDGRFHPDVTSVHDTVLRSIVPMSNDIIREYAQRNNIDDI